jgi:hypothetical protein
LVDVAISSGTQFAPIDRVKMIPDHAIGRLYTTEAPGMLKIAA